MLDAVEDELAEYEANGDGLDEDEIRPDKEFDGGGSNVGVAASELGPPEPHGQNEVTRGL